MSKDPAFLFYPGDYLRDTQCLSEKSQVAYDRIMCEHMRNICISKEQLNFFTKRLNEDEKSELMFLLVEKNNGYQIEWVADSIVKRKAYSESRRSNREKKEQKITKNQNIICKTYDKHMENEIENENVIEDEYINEESFKNFLLPKMFLILKSNKPGAFFSEKETYPILRQISEKLHKWVNLQGSYLDEVNLVPICDRWNDFLNKIQSQSFYRNYSILQILNNFSQLTDFYVNGNSINSSNNSKNGTAANRSNKQEGVEQIAEMLRKELDNAGLNEIRE